MTEMKSDSKDLSVFISYSRDDLEFADQLAAALGLHNFDVKIDRHGIAGGEDWRSRLGHLIRDADTIVFVLSPSSAVSEICSWEVEEATRLGKRILPVLCRPLGGATPPKLLAELNYIVFYDEEQVPGSGFGTGLVSLVHALNTDLDWLREHTRLLQRATEWEVSGRPSNRLLSGDLIAAAKEWVSRRPTDAPEPTALHLDFVHESEQEEVRQQSDERRRLDEMSQSIAAREAAVKAAQDAQSEKEAAQRRVVFRTGAGLVVSLVLAAAAGYFGLWALDEKQLTERARLAAVKAQQDAEKSRDDAEKSRDAAQRETKRATLRYSHYLATLANIELKNHNPEAALALGLEAFKGDGQVLDNIAEDIRAEQSIQQALLNMREKATLQATGKHGRPRKVLFTPDGSNIIALYDSGKLIIWDAKKYVSSEPPLSLRSDRPEPDGKGKRPRSNPTAALFNPANANQMLTIANDGTVRLWNWKQRKLTVELAKPAREARFNGVGMRVLTVAVDRQSAAVWSLDGKLIARIPERTEREHQILEFGATAGSETKLVTVTRGGNIEVWTIDPATQLATQTDKISGIEAPVARTGSSPVRFSRSPRLGLLSRDAAFALLIMSDGSAQVWDVAKKKRVYEVPDRGFRHGAFAPKGQRVVLVSQDGAVRLVNLARRGTGKVRVFQGHKGGVRYTMFGPNGRFLATEGADGTVRIWNIRSRKTVVVLRGNRLLQSGFSPDASKLVMLQRRSKMKIFDIGPLQPVNSLGGSDRITSNLVFSSDGGKVLYGIAGGAIRIRDRDGSGSTKELRDIAESVVWLAQVPDGSRLLALHANGDVTVWHLRDLQRGAVRIRDVIPTQRDVKKRDQAAIFVGNDPNVFAIVGIDGFALWNAKTGRMVLEENGDFLGVAGFSTTSETVVFATKDDSKTLIWSANTRSGERTKLFEREGATHVGFVDGKDTVMAFETNDPAGHTQLWSIKEKRLLIEWREGKRTNSTALKTWTTDRMYAEAIRLIDQSIIAVKEGFDIHLPKRPNGLTRIATAPGGKITIIDGRAWAKASQQDLSVQRFANLAVYPTTMKRVRRLTYGLDGHLIAVAAEYEPITLWRTFPTVRDLVEHARNVVPRCLSRDQRLQQLLGARPPDWCIKYKKRPYHTEQWQAWLTTGRQLPMPAQ